MIYGRAMCIFTYSLFVVNCGLIILDNTNAIWLGDCSGPFESGQKWLIVELLINL